MRCRCSMGFGRSLLSRALACVRARVRGFVSAVVSIVKCCPVYVALRGKNGMGVASAREGLCVLAKRRRHSVGSGARWASGPRSAAAVVGSRDSGSFDKMTNRDCNNNVIVLW